MKGSSPYHEELSFLRQFFLAGTSFLQYRGFGLGERFHSHGPGPVSLYLKPEHGISIGSGLPDPFSVGNDLGGRSSLREHILAVSPDDQGCNSDQQVRVLKLRVRKDRVHE